MDNENNDDVLGLDQPLKLGRVSRIPKLTDELLFENNRGLPQIRNNYTKLLRAIKKNDRKLAEKVQKEKLSKKVAHQYKVSTEVENLQKVLLFYQLWCHGLFPRATFKDCLKMLRTHKSVSIKEYRCGLLENEIKRLRIEKGIIVETPETEAHAGENADDLYTAPNNEIGVSSEPVSDPVIQPVDNSTMDESDDEDWGFLSTSRHRSNNLFIGDDDDDDEIANTPKSLNSTVPRTEETVSADKNDNVNVGGDDDDDDFDDFADFDNNDLVGLTNARPVAEEIFPAEADFEDFQDSHKAAQGKTSNDDEHDEELAIMREMGM